MKIVRFAAVTVAAIAAVAAIPASAQHNHGSHGAAPTQSKAGAGELADGEIRRIDAAKGTVLLKHGEIKSLNMGAMTMGFRLKDPAMAAGFKAGDKVRFVAEQKGEDLIITRMERQP